MSLNEHQRRVYEVVASLLGKPWRQGADGPDYFDCYSLAAHLQRECFSITMPIVSDRDKVSLFNFARNIMSHPEKVDWVNVETPRDGDLMIMGNVDGRDFHLGTYLLVAHTPMCVHIDDNAGVMLDDILTLRNVKGFYNIRYLRHRSKLQ